MFEPYFSFIITYPVTEEGIRQWNKDFSLNAYYAGKHWKERSKDKDYWKFLVTAALAKRKNVPGPAARPVRLIFLYNDDLDCSNHGAINKMIEDALCGTLIKNDSRKYVKGIYTGFHDKPYILVGIEMETEQEQQKEN